MIGLCSLSVFIGSLLQKGWSGSESFQYAMTQCCTEAVSLFGGYFLAACLVNALRIRLFMQDNDISLTRQFVGYAMAVLFLLQIIVGVLPDFHVIAWLLQFYIIYMVWEGSRNLMEVEEKDRLRFTLVSSILLIACPAAVRLLFVRLTLLLN